MSTTALQEAPRRPSKVKKPGDRVSRGDIVAEVDTDKGVIDVEIFTSGTIQKLLVELGQTVPIGTPLAIVQEEGTAAGAAAQ